MVHVDSTVHPGVTVISLQGDIDGKSAPATQEAVFAAVPEEGAVVLDMRGVAYMSSAGLRMLLLLYRQTTGNGMDIALAGLGDEIQDVMDATGFLAHFTVADDVEAALAAMWDRP